MALPRLDSLVVPVYRNAATIDAFITAIKRIAGSLDSELEVVFVIDGTPDSRERLVEAVLAAPFPARVIDHSRNFGSFAAIRTGMSLARGSGIAVMSADLQEPPELMVDFLERLATGEVDVVAGERASRDDRGDMVSKSYWDLYRRFVLAEIPRDGVDVFACTAQVRDVLCSLESVNTSLVDQLFWVGFRRELIPYDRCPPSGESGWTRRRKVRYMPPAFLRSPTCRCGYCGPRASSACRSASSRPPLSSSCGRAAGSSCPDMPRRCWRSSCSPASTCSASTSSARTRGAPTRRSRAGRVPS
jgi:glycosyltransferase involved in cell wall biosynthesis